VEEGSFCLSVYLSVSLALQPRYSVSRGETLGSPLLPRRLHEHNWLVTDRPQTGANLLKRDGRRNLEKAPIAAAVGRYMLEP
jgi:hypothetical protein